MTSDQQAQMLFLLAALALPLAGLIARRLSLRSGLRMALIWLVIFAIAAVIVGFLAPVLGLDLT